MKKYTVTIDLGSLLVEIEANSKEEAERLAIEQWENGELTSNLLEVEGWIADGETVEEEEIR